MAVASYTPRMLTADEAHADVALMRQALETIHPGLYRYSTRDEIDAAFARLDTATGHPLSDLDLWREVARVLAAIHCDHTKPEPSAAIDAYRQSHPTHLPFRFTMAEGRMIVVSNDGQPGAPPVGAEIVALDGLPIPQVVATLSQAVAYDGSTDQAIAAKLADDSDLMGDDLNEYWPAFYGFTDRWAVEWKTDGALKPTRSVLQPIGFKAWTELPWPGGRYRNEFYNGVAWRIAGNDAYLRLDTFVNYRNPVDATAFLGGFFRSLKASGAEHLILDLRNNGGGSEDVPIALGRYLLPTAFVWSKPVLLKAVRYGDLPAHIESWGDRKSLFEEPLSDFRRTADGWWERLPRPGNQDDESTLPQAVSPDRFAGRLTVLVGPRNGSGATRTIAQLKEKSGATLVGQDTGGSAEGPTAGHIFLLTLPNSGLKVRIPNAWNRTNIDHFTSGRGEAADQPVIETLVDAETGVDQVLDVAKATSPATAPGLAEVLKGEWSGTLDYRDFGSDRRTVLPTLAVVSTDGADTVIAFTFDDGPGKVVHGTERWSLSRDGKLLDMDGELYRVIERIGGGSTTDLTLVAEGTGKDNGHEVAVRIVVTRRGPRLGISRLTAKRGEPFLMRDAYTLNGMKTVAEQDRPTS